MCFPDRHKLLFLAEGRRKETQYFMNLFYRGYVIHREFRSICCTIFDRRPNRAELAACATSREAMQWVDRHMVQGEPVPIQRPQLAVP